MLSGKRNPGIEHESVDSDDESLIDSVAFTDDDIYSVLAPGGKFSSVAVRDWLGVAFNPIKIQTDIVFYEGTDAIVFPPVADGEPADSLSRSVSDALNRAAPLLSEEKYSGKKMLFPLTEVQPCFFGYGPRRMHWVTLQYDPTTEIATLIDSRPSLNSYAYLVHPMKQLLSEGLKSLGLSVKQLNPIYQGIQEDDIYCGPWTATTIEALANGMSLEDHVKTISSSDRDGMIAHHRKMLLSNLNTGTYQRVSTSGVMKEASSCESLSTERTSTESFSQGEDDSAEEQTSYMLNPAPYEDSLSDQIEAQLASESFNALRNDELIEEVSVHPVRVEVLLEERVQDNHTASRRTSSRAQRGISEDGTVLVIEITNCDQKTTPNHSFIIAALAHPVTKALSIMMLLSGLVLLGLVTAGLSHIPLMSGALLAGIGLFSGTGHFMTNRWAMQLRSDECTLLEGACNL